MTSTLAPTFEAPAAGNAFTWAIRDSVAMTRRNVLRLIRTPALVVFMFIQPVMFTLLFRYVFGGAIGLPSGIGYATYLIPGIAAQTAIFGASSTAVGLAEDLATGFVERLRSLPMARSAVLIGRLAADAIRNIFVIIILVLVGLAVGFRPHSVLPTVLGLLLVLGFSIAISCGMALLGMKVKGSESAQAASFPIVFPFTFASSAFVPSPRCQAGSRASPGTSRLPWSSTPCGRWCSDPSRARPGSSSSPATPRARWPSRRSPGSWGSR